MFFMYFGAAGLIFFFVSFQRIYRAKSKKDMMKVSSIADSLDIKRVKWAQQLTNKAS